MIEIRALGTLHLRTADGTVCQSVLAQPKRSALLVFLAVAGRPGAAHARDTLLGLFWPELDQERARKALNQSVYVLRRALGAAALVTREGQVGVDESRVWCDAVAFESLLDEGDAEGALALYGGDLLAGLYLDDAPEFERWHELERARLRQRAVEAALALAEARLEAGAAPAAIELLRRATAWAPYDERAGAALVRALEAAGDRAGAIREARAFSERLSRDLDIEAEPLAVELAERAATVAGPVPGPASAPAGLRAGGETTSAPAPAPAPAGRKSAIGLARRRRPLLSLGILLLVALPLGWLVVWQSAGPATTIEAHPGRPDALAAAEPVRVGDLINRTGAGSADALGAVVADRIVGDLRRAGFGNVSRPVSRGIGPTNGGDMPDSGVPSAGAEGVDVGGSIERAGEMLVFRVRITRGGTGEVVWPIEARGDTIAPLAGADEAGSLTAAALALMLDPRTASWAPAASKPPDIATYRAFVDALDLYQRSWSMLNANEARAMREEAVAGLTRAASDRFTAPLIWAVEAHLREMGSPAHPRARAQADSIVRFLDTMVTQLPAWDHAMLDYHRATLGFDRVAAYEAIGRVVALAPGSDWVYALAERAVDVNRPAEAVELLSRSLPRPPSIPIRPRYWKALADAHHVLGEYDRELVAVEAWRGEGGEGSGFLYLAEIRALVGSGRIDEAFERSREILGSTGHPGTPELRYLLPQELRAHGADRKARELATYALSTWSSVSAAAHDGARSWETTASQTEYYYGLTLYEAGWLDEAAEHFGALASSQPTVVNHVGMVGVVAAARGDRETALRISRELIAMAEKAEVRFQRGWILFYRARIAALMGDPAAAVRMLREGFLNGLAYGVWIHHRIEQEPLATYGPYREMVEPKG